MILSGHDGREFLASKTDHTILVVTQAEMTRESGLSFLVWLDEASSKRFLTFIHWHKNHVIALALDGKLIAEPTVMEVSSKMQGNTFFVTTGLVNSMIVTSVMDSFFTFVTFTEEGKTMADLCKDFFAGCHTEPPALWRRLFDVYKKLFGGA